MLLLIVSSLKTSWTTWRASAFKTIQLDTHRETYRQLTLVVKIYKSVVSETVKWRIVTSSNIIARYQTIFIDSCSMFLAKTTDIIKMFTQFLKCSIKGDTFLWQEGGRRLHPKSRKNKGWDSVPMFFHLIHIYLI